MTSEVSAEFAGAVRSGLGYVGDDGVRHVLIEKIETLAEFLSLEPGTQIWAHGRGKDRIIDLNKLIAESRRREEKIPAHIELPAVEIHGNLVADNCGLTNASIPEGLKITGYFYHGRNPDLTSVRKGLAYWGAFQGRGGRYIDAADIKTVADLVAVNANDFVNGSLHIRKLIDNSAKLDDKTPLVIPSFQLNGDLFVHACDLSNNQIMPGLWINGRAEFRDNPNLTALPEDFTAVVVDIARCDLQQWPSGNIIHYLGITDAPNLTTVGKTNVHRAEIARCGITRIEGPVNNRDAFCISNCPITCLDKGANTSSLQIADCENLTHIGADIRYKALSIADCPKLETVDLPQGAKELRAIGCAPNQNLRLTCALETRDQEIAVTVSDDLGEDENGEPRYRRRPHVPLYRRTQEAAPSSSRSFSPSIGPGR